MEEMRKDELLVHVSDADDFYKSQLYDFLKTQGYKDAGKMLDPAYPHLLINITDRTFEAGSSEMNDRHVVGNHVITEEDFYQIYNLFYKYRDLPKEVFDDGEWAIAEMDRRIQGLPFEVRDDGTIILGQADFHTDVFDGQLQLMDDTTDEMLMYSVDCWDHVGDNDVEISFTEGLTLESVAFAYIRLQDFLMDLMEERYYGISWGRAEIMINNDKNDKRVDLILYLDNRKEYDGSGSYLRLELDEQNVRRIMKMLKRAYPHMKEAALKYKQEAV